MVNKIISGGQTGADRSALDWALSRGLEIGGWCPAGRLAEDGTIPLIYPLRETPSKNYLVRTRLNVRDSDATLIVTPGKKLTRGSLRTSKFANELGKPWLHVCSALPVQVGTMLLCDFFSRHQLLVLNVAGSRESKAPGIGSFVHELLDLALGGSCPHDINFKETGNE